MDLRRPHNAWLSLVAPKIVVDLLGILLMITPAPAAPSANSPQTADRTTTNAILLGFRNAYQFHNECLSIQVTLQSIQLSVDNFALIISGQNILKRDKNAYDGAETTERSSIFIFVRSSRRRV
jgi:hypothetical protein